MNLSRRERWIAAIALATVALLVGDRWVFTPLADRYRADAQRAATLELEQIEAERLMQRRGRLQREWTRRLAAGVGLDVSAAEGALLTSIGRWASEAGVSLTSMKPDRSEAKEDLTRIACRLSARGSMASIGRFCWRLETAEMPLRIESLRLSARDSTVDELTATLDVSTICRTGGERLAQAGTEVRP
jgi:Tfp pilus assembly protein PilO